MGLFYISNISIPIMKKVMIAGLVSSLFLTACDKDIKEFFNKDTIFTPEKMEKATQTAENLDKIFEVIDKNNHEVKAIYDIGVNGFKLVISNDKNNKASTKSVISDDGEYFLAEAMKIQNGEMLSSVVSTTKFAEENKSEIVKKYISEGFDKTASMSFVKGNGERKLLVMTDPDCPYCQQFEKTLENIDNITVTYIFLPLEIHPDAKNKADKIWRSANNDEGRVKAWHEFHKTGKLPEPINQNPAYNFDYAEKVRQDLNAVATPFLVNLNTGESVAGALPQEHLENFLNATKEEANKVFHNYKKLYPKE